MTRSTNVVVAPIIDKYLEHMLINLLWLDILFSKMNFQSNIGNNPKWELKFSSIYYVPNSMLVKNLE